MTSRKGGGRVAPPDAFFLVAVLIGAGCVAATDGSSQDDAHDAVVPWNAPSVGQPSTLRLHPQWLSGSVPSLPPPSNARFAQHFATGAECGEPSMDITSHGSLFVVVCAETMRSLDGGLTWDVVYTSSKGTWDPILVVDASTDRVFTNHLIPTANLPACTLLAISADDGETWTENDRACGVPLMDFQKLGVGPRPANTRFPLASDPSVVYLCHHKQGFPVCEASYDGGSTFPVSRSIAPGLCGGPTGWPVVNDAGVVAIASGSCAAPTVSVSADGGWTWSFAEGPGETGSRSADARVAFSSSGDVYLLWRGDDYVMYLARSADLGASWVGPWRVSPADVKSASFQALEAGSDGRVAMAFLGSRDYEGDPADAPPGARFHLWIVTSEDADAADPKFLAMQATPDADPVQIGCISMGRGSPCRNLGDFLDSATGPDGTFWIAYTDGCDAACDLQAEQSEGGSVIVAALRGWGLGPHDGDEAVKGKRGSGREIIAPAVEDEL